MTTTTRTSTPGILPALTGIRAIAAVWVVLFHFREALAVFLSDSYGFIAPVIEAGHYGVDLFFILSGYILALNYIGSDMQWTPASVVAFLRARLARLYPVHFVTLHLALILIAVASVIGKPVSIAGSPGEYIQHLLLVHQWDSGPFLFNYPAWSISCEWFAYLLFPLLAVVFRRAHPAALTAGLLGVWAVSLLSVGGVLPGNEYLWRVSLEFTAGVLLYLLSPRLPRSFAWGAVAAGAAVGMVALSYAPDLLAYARHALFAALILALSFGQGRLAAWLSSPRMIYGGETSYSLYMIHGLVQLAVMAILPPNPMAGLPMQLITVVVYIVALILPTLVLYHWVEVPGRRWLRGSKRGRIQRTVTVNP